MAESAKCPLGHSMKVAREGLREGFPEDAAVPWSDGFTTIKKFRVEPAGKPLLAICPVCGVVFALGS